ncbi:hypothetical protein HMPREF1531_02005 [Propionibacterium sp. oral taxon 192 str. F0372]|uniref:MFS transporter n=1 Tax=Propionibacterium sp. oral taxon 192 TaxID=671222 RepID=UPI000352B3B9|nr:MFS transporter [Propionibacterium sp. oral taxon 192]EPH02694.1 hypothetical protein HMPREF1531_02005 [Propionibacterium sp. oral taxon 192 str. F0372]
MNRLALRHQIACSLAFFTNGAVFGSLLPRYPEIKNLLGLTNTQYGLTVIAVSLGGLLALNMPSRLLARWAPPHIGIVATVVMGGALVITGTASLWPMVFVALLLAGIADAVSDTAQNAQAIAVQEASGRSLINRMHAFWSLGSACGGVTAVLASRAHIDLGIQLLGTGFACTAAMVVSAWLSSARLPDHHRLAAPAQKPTATARGKTSVKLIMTGLVMITMTSTLTEDFANNWATLYFHKIALLDPGTAGLAYTTVMVSQFAGRIASDPVTDRIGAARTCVVGCVMVALGLLTVVVSPLLVMRWAGLIVIGVGCAPLTPTAYAASGSIATMSSAGGITLMSWFLRAGGLAGSPLLGLASDGFGLRWAILLPTVLAVAGTGFAVWMWRTGNLRTTRG